MPAAPCTCTRSSSARPASSSCRPCPLSRRASGGRPSARGWTGWSTCARGATASGRPRRAKSRTRQPAGRSSRSKDGEKECANCGSSAIASIDPAGYWFLWLARNIDREQNVATVCAFCGFFAKPVALRGCLPICGTCNASKHERPRKTTECALCSAKIHRKASFVRVLCKNPRSPDGTPKVAPVCHACSDLDSASRVWDIQSMKNQMETRGRRWKAMSEYMTSNWTSSGVYVRGSGEDFLQLILPEPHAALSGLSGRRRAVRRPGLEDGLCGHERRVPASTCTSARGTTTAPIRSPGRAIPPRPRCCLAFFLGSWPRSPPLCSLSRA